MIAWQLVPAEPTTGMLVAGEDASTLGYEDLTRVYKAMLDAAPVALARSDTEMTAGLPVAWRYRKKFWHNDKPGPWSFTDDGELWLGGEFDVEALYGVTMA